MGSSCTFIPTTNGNRPKVTIFGTPKQKASRQGRIIPDALYSAKAALRLEAVDLLDAIAHVRGCGRQAETKEEALLARALRRS